MTGLNGFNRVAKIYDVLARIMFGQSIKKAQLHFVDRIPKHAKVLILGGGSGWVLKEIFQRNETCETWYVEASSTMIELSKHKVKTQWNIHFIHGTECDVDTSIDYDVIVTNFFLDLFSEDELQDVIVRLKKNLKQGGVWLATDFVNQNKWWQLVLLKVMYWFFGIAARVKSRKLSRWELALIDEGLKRTEVKAFYQGFIEASIFVQPIL